MLANDMKQLKAAGAAVEDPSEEVLNQAKLELQAVIDAECGTVTPLADAPSSGPDRVGSGTRTASRRRRSWRVGAVAAGVVAAVAAVVLVLPDSPTTQQLPSSKTDQLRLIATNASHQPALSLGTNQWLQVDQSASVTFTANHYVPDGTLYGRPEVTSAPIPNATATATVTGTTWYSSVGQVCEVNVVGPLTFASPANRSAWETAGLSDTANNDGLAECPYFEGANALNGFTKGIGAVDVSGLPTDPSILASELSQGTTAIPGLTQNGTVGNQGFEEALLLLTGPSLGEPASFGGELYTAISDLPGVDKLGTVKTHSGATGLGFSAPTSKGRTSIVVDVSTGRLLEVQGQAPRSFSDALAGAPLQIALSAHGLAPINAGIAVTTVFNWTDSIGDRAVVSSSALPAHLSVPPVPTAVVVATTHPGVGDPTDSGSATGSDPVDKLFFRLGKEFGGPGEGWGGGGSDVEATFTSTRSQVDSWTKAMQASGLFSSVTVDWGDVPTTAPSF